ncbi:MAG: type II secretion system F family protein [Lachnospiraceae bacterium]|nr:type II secretion system F family protein [Lachnospiraceae bacterium]
MIKYKYKAKNSDGKMISGVVQANDIYELHERLKQDGKFLISQKEIINKKNNKRLKSNVISEFSKNISELVGSGISLVKALRIISEDESTKPAIRAIYSDVLKLLKTGMSLSDALTEQGDAFPPLFINMMKSAETSGNLDKIAMRMSQHYDKEYRLNQKVKSSMTYPKILSVLIIGAVAVIMGFVIPQFKDLFAQMETLPISTTILLGISNFIKDKWYVLIIAAIVFFILFKIVFSIAVVQYFVDKIKIKLPVIGKLMRVIYTARFARTLASLYSAGISIVNCLTISKSTIGNAYIESQFDKMIAEVKAGANLSDAINDVDGFTKKLSSSIMVGEETGALDTMLNSVANQMEYDSEMALDKMVALIEPVMVVVMAVVIGFIIISIIQPIYGSYQSIADSVG